MLLHDARREARMDKAGDIVVLEEQDRTRWDQRQIAEALPLVRAAFQTMPGPYALQAAIAAEHCRAARPADTNWAQILRMYDLLDEMQPSPVVSLNRAVAVAMAHGPLPALELIDELEASGDLDGYHLLHSARADLLRRAGSREEAAKSYELALTLVTNASERRYLERRLREVQGG
jgi:RNA polymerase sigma-70 factor (ECF subfamily)